MRYTVKAPGTLDATINLPASKSMSNRALIIHALSGKGALLGNLSDCDDTEAVIRALETMPGTIDIGAAGTAMRFLTAYLATVPGERTLTGTERMRQRPISPLVDALRFLGADIAYEGEEGYPPLRIRGKRLRGGTIEMPGDVSSQYISALLMIGPALDGGLNVKLIGDIISRPYIDLTLSIMQDFGADVEWTGRNAIRVMPTGYSPREYLIESDWSSASYWYEMVALSDSPDTEVRLEGLMDGSHQGDSSVRYLFNMLGVRTVFKSREKDTPTTVTLKKVERMPSRLDYDFINQPDMAQTFVVCCALLGVHFHFTGLRTLTIKETDRINALKREMLKLGYVIQGDGTCGLKWDGQRREPEGFPVIDTYGDHRMALAFAPAALRLGSIGIDDPGVVSKSYPRFWDDLGRAGFSIERSE